MPKPFHRARRHLSTARFALMTGQEARDIARWQLPESVVWIPQPDILLGEKLQPGWDIRIIATWTRTATPLWRPEPLHYHDTTQIMRQFRIQSQHTLWNLIAAEQIHHQISGSTIPPAGIRQ